MIEAKGIVGGSLWIAQNPWWDGRIQKHNFRGGGGDGGPYALHIYRAWHNSGFIVTFWFHVEVGLPNPNLTTCQPVHNSGKLRKGLPSTSGPFFQKYTIGSTHYLSFVMLCVRVQKVHNSAFTTTCQMHFSTQLLQIPHCLAEQLDTMYMNLD